MKNEKRKSRYFKKIIFFFSFNLIALFFIVIFLEIFLYIFFDGIIRKDGSYLKKHDVFGAVNKNSKILIMRCIV